MSWSVADAKAHLSEILRRARAGEPQIVGTQDPCVVISMREYERHAPPRRSMGPALVDLAAQVGADVDLPARGGRPVNFADD
jgi:prevent-host-death family protein